MFFVSRSGNITQPEQRFEEFWNPVTACRPNGYYLYIEVIFTPRSGSTT